MSEFFCGRTAHPEQSRMRVRLESFMDLSLVPDPPATFDYTPLAANSLKKVYLNNQLGDCVIALGYHFKGVWSANAGHEIIVSDQEIIHDYSKIGGYNGTRRSDQGCNEQDALHYWQTVGFTDGDKIEGWLTVNPHDLAAAKKICWLFEGLFYGSGLPDSWLNTNPGFVWDAGRPNPNNGHAFGSFGWDGAWKVSTWGMVGHMTDAAHQRNIDEAYVLLNDTMVNKVTQKAPNAVDWNSLISYWNSIGGKLPEPPRPLPTDWLTL